MGALNFPSPPTHDEIYEKWQYDSDAGRWELVTVPVSPTNLLWSEGLNGNIYYDSGNVGIGITAPTQPLDVVGNATVSGTVTGNSLVKSGGTGSEYLMADGTVSTGYDLPLATASDRGGVKIGYSANGKNYPVALSSEQMYVNVPWTDTTYTAGNGMKLTGAKFEMSGSYTGTFTASGDVVAYSDVAVKEDINPIIGALEKVSQLGGYTFKRKNDDSRKYTGVIAQEVKKVLPEAVHGEKDGELAVAYGNLVGLLIEAVKEQQVQINELKDKLEK